MKKTLLIIPILLVALVPLPGYANGCEILATGAASGTCTYVATGPGEYRVGSVSGFRIEIISPAARKKTLVAKAAVYEDPVSGIVAAAGDLATQPGDLIGVAITIGRVTTPNGPIYYQDGFAMAGDKA